MSGLADICIHIHLCIYMCGNMDTYMYVGCFCFLLCMYIHIHVRAFKHGQEHTQFLLFSSFDCDSSGKSLSGNVIPQRQASRTGTGGEFPSGAVT